MFTRLSSSGYLPAGDDLDRELEEVYARIIATRGVRTDEEELVLVNELVRRAEQGSFPQDGAMHIISPRADIDWASDEAMLAVRPPATRSNALIAGGVLIAGAVLFALFSLLGSDSGNRDVSSASGTATALAASGVSGTLAVDATRTAVAQATAVWAGSGIVVGTDYKQKLPALYPETLEIDGVPFRVYPSAIDGGRWAYQQVEGTASWIGGTVINWSFGLPALDPNMALFKRLEEAVDASGMDREGGEGREGEGGKEALLRMSGGVVRHFRLHRPVQIERQQIEVFMQNQPGLTVVLLGDEQGVKRWLLQGVEDHARSGYGAGYAASYNVGSFDKLDKLVNIRTRLAEVSQTARTIPTIPVPSPGRDLTQYYPR